MNKTKNGKDMPSLEVFLVQCNLVDNQHQQKSEVLYTFAPNKSCGCVLNVETNNYCLSKL